MKLKADPKQRLLVLSMMFGETAAQREPTLGTLGKRIAAQKRKELEFARVCRTQKRGRATHLLLDNEAEQFVLENLAEPLPASPAAARVLTAVLGRLKSQLETKEVSAALFGFGGSLGSKPTTPDEADAAAPIDKPASEEDVRDACLSLAGGQVGKRVRLADLRERISASRESLDTLLKSMQMAGRLVLFKMDNPAEITPADDKAALVIAGHPRHLVYLEA